MKKITAGIIISMCLLAVFTIGFFSYSDPQIRFYFGQLIGQIPSPEISSSQHDFDIELVASGIARPTTMTFVDDDILVLEKNTGKVKLIKDGLLLSDPILDFNVFASYEGGLLGSTTKENFVYLYLTETDVDGGTPIADYVYRYEWNENNLENPSIVNSFEVSSVGHHGGAMTTTSDGKILLVRGDQRGGDLQNPRFGVLQNYAGDEYDDTGVIIIIEKDENILRPSESENPLAHYYSIGIRNSFGITEDPVTKNIWITENGPVGLDEVNLAYDGFNSGWARTAGPASETQISKIPKLEGFEYSDPEFSWQMDDLVPTAIVFPADHWPKEFRDSVFVGTCGLDGHVFNFKLNENRNGFVFDSLDLQDNFANLEDDLNEIILLKNLKCVTDLEFGPDGSLYIVYHANNGAIYKVTPR